MVVRTWQEFAREIIRINDLDCTYELMYKARLEYGDEWANKFALHMLMFYHLGEAAEAASKDTSDFWFHVMDNYATCRRGVERRHFRGANGLNSIASLMARFPDPSDAIVQLAGSTYLDVRKSLKGVLGFGDYFIWKVCDYLDRVFGLPVDFSNGVRYMPSEPSKCAKALWPAQTVEATLQMVVEEIQQYPAPPDRGRPCGISEAETVLCGLKGYFITKVHVIGDDILDKYNALLDDPYNLRRFLPPLHDLNEWERG
jgi:hypothetical protein